MLREVVETAIDSMSSCSQRYLIGGLTSDSSRRKLAINDGTLGLDGVTMVSKSCRSFVFAWLADKIAVLLRGFWSTCWEVIVGTNMCGINIALQHC